MVGMSCGGTTGGTAKPAPSTGCATAAPLLPLNVPLIWGLKATN